MKEYYLTLIVFMFLVPIIISPMTVEAVQIDDGEANGIVQFESPRNFTSIKNDIISDFHPTINATLTNFLTNEISGFTANIHEGILLNELGVNQTSGLTIYEMNAEVNFSGTTTGNIGQFIDAFEIFILEIRDDIVTFLNTQDASQATSYLKLPTGKVITREI